MKKSSPFNVPCNWVNRRVPCFSLYVFGFHAFIIVYAHVFCSQQQLYTKEVAPKWRAEKNVNWTSSLLYRRLWYYLVDTYMHVCISIADWMLLCWFCENALDEDKQGKCAMCDRNRSSESSTRAISYRSPIHQQEAQPIRNAQIHRNTSLRVHTRIM